MSDTTQFAALPMSPTQKGHLVLIVAGVVVIFLIDVQARLGLAAGALYVPLVLYTTVLHRPQLTLYTGAVAVLAIGIGFVVSPPAPAGFPILFVWLNRIISVAVVVIVTWLVIDRTRKLLQQQQFDDTIAKVDALFAQQQQLLAAARSVGDLGHWAFDLLSGKVSWSDEVARIHGVQQGYSPESIDAALDFFIERDRTYVKTVFHKARVEGKPFEVEAQINTADGRLVWVRSVGMPFVSSQGRVTRIQGALQDITTRKRADEVTSFGFQRFQQLAESMPIIVWTATKEGQVDYVTPLFFKYSGLTGRSLGHDQWIRFIHTDDQARVKDAWSKCVESGGQYEVEVRLRRADGEYRWHLVRAVRVNEACEIKWYGSAIDIHDQIQDLNQRKAVQEQMRLYQLAISRLNDAVIITEANNLSEPGPVIVFVNDAFVARTGYSVTEALGRSPRFLQGPGTSQEALELIRAHLERGESVRTELLNYTKSGEEIWFEIDIAPLTDEHGNCTHFVAIERDITTRKLFDERLRSMQRGDALGQLMRASVQEVSLLLSEMLEQIRHLDSSFPTQGVDKSSVKTLVALNHRGFELTRQLLEFTEHRPLTPRPVDVNAVILKMQPLLGRVLPAEIQLHVIAAAGLGRVKVDATLLEEMILTLLLNARDAMSEGGVLTIETANITPENLSSCADVFLNASERYVAVSVSDTGHGIPETVRDRIFEPFFTTKTATTGTGLGLPMVYRFVEQARGHVCVDSEPGRGTRVTLLFPLVVHSE